MKVLKNLTKKFIALATVHALTLSAAPLEAAAQIASRARIATPAAPAVQGALNVPATNLNLDLNLDFAPELTLDLNAPELSLATPLEGAPSALRQAAPDTKATRALDTRMTGMSGRLTDATQVDLGSLGSEGQRGLGDKVEAILLGLSANRVGEQDLNRFDDDGGAQPEGREERAAESTSEPASLEASTPDLPERSVAPKAMRRPTAGELAGTLVLKGARLVGLGVATGAWLFGMPHAAGAVAAATGLPVVGAALAIGAVLSAGGFTALKLMSRVEETSRGPIVHTSRGFGSFLAEASLLAGVASFAAVGLSAADSALGVSAALGMAAMGTLGEGKQPADEDAAFAAKVKAKSAFVDKFREQYEVVIVGQEEMRDVALRALLIGGHVLLEGIPGVAKTRAINTIGDVLGLQFERIQFTRDLQPSDIVGQEELNQQTGEWTIRRGPVHTNLLLADEINRATPKTQGALLEAMAEKQVTIAGQTEKLDDPFVVLATQNPLEQEGVYPLPEAQLDRFAFKVIVPMPSESELAEISRRNRKKVSAKAQNLLSKQDLLEVQDIVENIRVSEEIDDYIARIVSWTHPGRGQVDLDDLVRQGASPRAAIMMAKAAQAEAFIQGRWYVTPEDVRKVAPDVLRHRLALTFEAEESTTVDAIIEDLLHRVPVK